MSTYAQVGDQFLYLPYVYGLDASSLKTIAGGVSLSSNKILVTNNGSAGELSTRDSFQFGDFRSYLTVPTAPTAADDRFWGLYAKEIGLKDCAIFVVSGTHFYARSYDSAGNKEETEITWLAAWTNAEAIYEIRFMYKDQVEFLVNGISVARHTTRIPDPVVRPWYLKNNLADNLTVNVLDFRNVRASSGLAEIGATVTLASLPAGTNLIGKVQEISNLVHVAYDAVTVTWNAGTFTEVFAFTLAAATVATVTVVYTDATKDQMASATLS